MSSISSEITNMQNQTAYYNQQKKTTTNGMANDSNMFLTLMLQQLQNQDPTQPTDNTEWLAQLAQYSSLEQMTEMNKGLSDCMQYLNAMYNDMTLNSEITQTLSLIGKEVTIKDPDDETGKKTITGKAESEAAFRALFKLAASVSVTANGNGTYSYTKVTKTNVPVQYTACIEGQGNCKPKTCAEAAIELQNKS